MLKLNSLHKKYLSILYPHILKERQWQKMHEVSTSFEAVALLKNPHCDGSQPVLERDFATFFQRHFGYALHKQQLELFQWFYEGLEIGRIQERQLLATRRIGKTDILTIGAVAWKLIEDRSFKFIIISKSLANINVINNKIREILSSYNLLVQASQHAIMIKGAKNRGDKSSSIRFLTNLSNKRGLRADHIILDDLVDASDASAIVREQTLLTYSECRSIVPSTTLIGQLAHEKDLPSQLLKRCDVDNKELWLMQVEESLSKAIGLLNLPAIEKQYPKRYIGHNFTGYHYKDECLQYFSQVATGAFHRSSMIWAFVDPAFGGKDKTGITLISLYNKKIYANIHESNYNLADLDQVMAMLAWLKKEGATQVVVETNHGGDVLFKLREVYNFIEKLDIYLDKVHHHRSKVDRIMDIYPYRMQLILSGNVDCVRTWEREISTQAGSWRQHDDGIDSLATGISYLASKGVLLMNDLDFNEYYIK